MFRICRYSDFHPLLEAKLVYTERFSGILAEMAPESPVAKRLLDLAGKEVDTNTNRIDVFPGERDDIVLFRPEDKASKAVMIMDSGGTYYRLTRLLMEKEAESSAMTPAEMLAAPIIGIPNDGQVGQIKRWIEWPEVEAISGKLTRGAKGLFKRLCEDVGIFIFEWRQSGRLKCIVADRSNSVFGIEAVKDMEIGVGKLARALLVKSGEKFTDKDIEAFVNAYRGTIHSMNKDMLERFEVVEGDDIYDRYHSDSYDQQKGTLGSSCMRYDECRHYLEIYAKNPGVCRLLVLRADEAGKISGRALLWVDSQGRKIMDRVYTSDRRDEHLFAKWARQNGFYSRADQAHSESPKILGPDGNPANIKSIIELRPDISEYRLYPYMDTFKYYTIGNPSTLANDPSDGYDYELIETDGSNGAEEGEDN